MRCGRASTWPARTSTADRVIEAKHLLDEVAAAVPGRYDAPEERRAQALGAGLMPTVLARLK